MFSRNSSANLKVVGAEGHSPESLRQEVARGAKFVIYSYNFSLVVLSFKRPSNIHFIRPGESPVVKGLPFTLTSLVFGWWGIPWGVIYTFQSLHQNLTGGTDVTQALLASLAPPPPTDGSSTTESRPVAPSPRRPAKQVSARQILVTGGVVLALAAVVYTCVCFFYGQNLPVALVSGLKTPYSVELNGTPYQLKTGHPQLVTLAEGDFVLRGAPGTKDDQPFTARTDFFSRPFDRHVLVVNPDRVAVIYRETVNYHPTGTTPDPNEKPGLDLYVNRTSHYLPAPDHFFEALPKSISMPSGTTTLGKSRVTAIEDISIAAATSLITEKLGYEATRDYLTNRSRIDPENESLERLIISLLKPADGRALLEAHLPDRPLLVEWHRAYQYFMDRNFPAVDLVGLYRKQMDADPDNGVLIYLYARLLPNPAEADPLYEKALHAKRPSPYAAYALAFDAFIAGRYTTSLDFLERAKRGGVNMDSLQLCERDTLLALDRQADVLAAVKERQHQNPTDTELFADELLLSQSKTPDRVGGRRAISAFVATLRGRFGADDYQSVEDYLNGRLSYGMGEERESAAYSAKLKGQLNQFESAVGRRDHVAAAKAVASVTELPARYYLLLMLTAYSSGQNTAADAYFQQAVVRLQAEDKSSRAAAELIRGNTAADHAALLQTSNFAAELRVLFTALGVHFPDYREAYFARARELDRDPAFPHLLLTAIRKDSAPVTKL